MLYALFSGTQQLTPLGSGYVLLCIIPFVLSHVCGPVSRQYVLPKSLSSPACETREGSTSQSRCIASLSTAPLSS